MVWNPLKGKLQTLVSSSRYFEDMFCVSDLIVLLKNIDGCVTASVFKCNNETGNTPELIIDGESLDMYYDSLGLNEGSPRVIYSDESLGFFGILGRSRKHAGSDVLQLRSKSDFSLLSEFIENAPRFLLRYRSLFLLSDCFIFADTMGSEEDYLDVQALIDGEVKLVYAFEKNRFNKTLHDITVVGEFLVLHNRNAMRYRHHVDHSAASIWQLPANFIETCFNHLAEGTVGVLPLQCNQLVSRHHATQCRGSGRIQHVHADKYGVMSIVVKKRGGTAMHVMMLNLP